MGYGCANTALAGLAITLVVRREGGLLKRLRATPLPAATYLTAVLVCDADRVALQMALTVVLGVTLYGAARGQAGLRSCPCSCSAPRRSRGSGSASRR